MIGVLQRELRNGENARKQSRNTETRIIKVLKEAQGVRLVKAVCREYGIPDATWYKWKPAYGDTEDPDLKRLKELEDENRRFKHRYAELSLDHKILKDMIDLTGIAKDILPSLATDHRDL